MQQSIRDQIESGNIGKLYLLFGEEPYLARLGANRLEEALLTEEDRFMNRDLMKGKIDLQSLESSIETLPFLCERRVVRVEESGFFAKKEPREDEIIRILSNIPPTTTVIFLEKEVNRTFKLYKTIDKLKAAYDYKPLSDADLLRWMMREAQKAGCELAPSEAELLLSYTGSAMDHILPEIQKLCALCAEKKRIGSKDIEEIITPSIEYSVFKLTDMIGSGEREKAYELFLDLLRQNEKKEVIFYLILRQFHMLFTTTLMEKEPDEALMKELSQSRSFIVQKYRRQAAYFKRPRILAMVRKLYQLDYEVKSGQISLEEAMDLILLAC